MERRTLIKQAIILSAGASLLPYCRSKESAAFLPLKNLPVSGEQHALLVSLAEMILPQTDTLGAGAVGSTAFALLIIDDCFAEPAQQSFMQGLAGFQELVRQKYGKSFPDCSLPQKEELLTSLEGKKPNSVKQAGAFYTAYKRLTVQAYQSSSYYLTKVHPYELIPGPYHGCVPAPKT